MSQLDKVVYLQPPVAFDVKREWNKKGYRVDEIQNMPEGFDNPANEAEPTEEKPKRGK
jgi:hypothetical protein